jgi:hypothetical protein
MDGKNVVNVLAAMKERMNDDRATVARFALGWSLFAEKAVIPVEINCVISPYLSFAA